MVVKVQKSSLFRYFHTGEGFFFCIKDKVLIDPACGTSGFLVAASEYLKENRKQEVFFKCQNKDHYMNHMFHGFDMDRTMEYTKIKDINEYVSQSVNPMKTPDQIFEMYSVPIYETGHPEYLRGDEIASNKVVVQKNDVLLCKINPRINRVWVVADESENMNIASSEWIVIRNSEYNPEYLAWYFRTPRFQKLMVSEMTGIGGSLTRAQPKAVAEYPVPVLKREKQDEIVKVLNKISGVISNRKRELQKLDELIKARFVEMFGNPDINEKKWNEYKMEQLCEVGSSKRIYQNDQSLTGIPFLRISDLVSEMTGIGGSLTRAQPKAVAEYPVPVLKREKQDEIVKVLNKISGVISNRKRELQKLDELIKARFVEMFGNPDINEKKWNEYKMEQLCEVGSSKRIYQNDQSLTGIPFLRISDLVNRMDTGSKDCDLFIPEELFGKLKKQGVVPVSGDILLTARGTLGRCYIIQDEDEFYFQDGMITWLSKYDERITPLYISYLFEMPGFRKQIDSLQAGSTVAYLSISMTKKLNVMTLPIELQEQFSDFVKQVDKSKVVELIAKNMSLLLRSGLDILIIREVMR